MQSRSRAHVSRKKRDASGRVWRTECAVSHSRRNHTPVESFYRLFLAIQVSSRGDRSTREFHRRAVRYRKKSSREKRCSFEINRLSDERKKHLVVAARSLIVSVPLSLSFCLSLSRDKFVTFLISEPCSPRNADSSEFALLFLPPGRSSSSRSWILFRFRGPFHGESRRGESARARARP